MLIKDLPPFIRDIALERQKEQNNQTDKNEYLVLAFSWRKTTEGYRVWENVNLRNYEPFYRFHYYGLRSPNLIYISPYDYIKQNEAYKAVLASGFSRGYDGFKEYQEAKSNILKGWRGTFKKGEGFVLYKPSSAWADLKQPKPYYLTKTIEIDWIKREITLAAVIDGNRLNVGYSVRYPKDKTDKDIAKKIAKGRALNKKTELVSLVITPDMKKNYIYKAVLENTFQRLERGELTIKGIR